MTVQVLDTVDPDRLRAARSSHEPLWLDLRDPGEAELAQVGEILGLHELAIEDSREFGQRPKLDRYDERVLLVFYGLYVGEDQIPRQVEVHMHLAPGYVLTISRVPPAQLEQVRHSLADGAECSQGQLVYRVLDAVVDSVTDGLGTVADQIDAFEARIFTRPRAGDRDRMAVLRRTLNQLRRTLLIEYEVFTEAVDRVAAAAGEDEDIRPYLADVGDHLRRALDETDGDRETLTGMLETYANEVQERLTIVATIFLPLTVLTGFFGMNFNWMINHIGGAWTFFGLGIGGLIASCLIISAWLRHQGLVDRGQGRAVWFRSLRRGKPKS